ncbi:MAG: CapA family protein [bacterium]|nr:CapA family protein [bacterium]
MNKTIRKSSLILFVSLFIFLFICLPFASSKEDGQTITFIAVGDIMMGRHIGKVMKRRGDLYPFMNFTSPFKEADILFANLESTLGDENDKIYFPDKPYNFIAPLTVSKTLKYLGFNVLSLANNHAMDYGADSIVRTGKELAEKGISSFGAGRTLDEARRPSIITKKGVAFGFLGYSNGHSSGVYASGGKAGVVPTELKIIKEDIMKLKGKVDLIVVSLHWGIEYEKYPTMKQRELAHMIIDSGADMILGHHPHVMQGLELYKGKIIAYSLGNFLFDQRHKGTDESFMLKLKYRGDKLDEISLGPVDRFQSFYPRPATGEARRKIMKGLREISAPLNPDPSALQRLGL